ncbi:pectinesterase inhibitor-like [Pistacia vera]|uniref:pectinesterase inhibitor-like n=1 Tax=Pistacia vera TaxID=55513 RepID=UPI0012638067|nr:pectinesterase inhibitor-like [Pistacia vera]
MASFKRYFFRASILLGMLFVAPSLARLNEKVTKGVINDICSKTQNLTFCLGVLNQAPGASTADLPGLAKITIDLATSNATETLQIIQSLVPKTTNTKLKEGYATCSEHYDNAIGDLGDARQHLKTGDPMGVNLSASASMDEAGDCNDELKGLPADPSVLKGNQDLNNICSIILVIANRIPR